MSRFPWLWRQPERKTKGEAVSRIIEHEAVPGLIYAIGDIHGCYAQFRELENRIVADAKSRAEPAHIVVLGDFVDRGPGVRAVIDDLLATPPEGVTRIVLSGNHEAMMSRFVAHPSHDDDWLRFGGIETLASYGIDAARWRREGTRAIEIIYELEAMVPTAHLAFIADRPFLVRYGNLVFVHAGIDRTLPLTRQTERDLLWMRPLPGDEPLTGPLVVHGHTPGEAVFVSPTRINVDTGAYAGRALSAARFTKGRFDGVLASTL